MWQCGALSAAQQGGDVSHMLFDCDLRLLRISLTLSCHLMHDLRVPSAVAGDHYLGNTQRWVGDCRAAESSTYIPVILQDPR